MSVLRGRSSRGRVWTCDFANPASNMPQRLRGMRQNSTRRTFLACSAGVLASAAVARCARADVLAPSRWNVEPPTDDRDDFINWMQINRGEEPIFLSARWNRFIAL